MIKITKIITKSFDDKTHTFPYMIKDCDKKPFKKSLLAEKQKIYNKELAKVNCFAVIKTKKC